MGMITAAQAAQGVKGTVATGRKKGAGNKSTAAAREMIASFIDGNSDRLQTWLDEIYAEKGAIGAFAAFTALIDYHVPKLARVEHTGKDEGPVEISISWAGDQA